ncbi:MAG: isochorismatase family protein [Caulobacterales bacterium]
MLVSHSARTPTLARRSRPWLVCLDLQREFVVPGRPQYAAASAEVARTCGRLLALARGADWRVLHSQLRREHGAFCRNDHFGAPIEGLRPLISEPVYLRRGLSAFSNPDFAAELGEAHGEDVYLIGFSLADTCLATALAAVDHGHSLVLVEDAVGAGAAAWPDVSAIARSILKPFARLVSSGDVEADAREIAS